MKVKKSLNCPTQSEEVGLIPTILFWFFGYEVSQFGVFVKMRNFHPIYKHIEESIIFYNVCITSKINYKYNYRS